jgi:hypothetical protein
MFVIALAFILLSVTRAKTQGNSPVHEGTAKCYRDADVVTLRGIAYPQSLKMADGSVKVVWILTTKNPVCVVQSLPWDDAPRRANVTRVQVIGTPPPAGATLELRGKLSTGNVTQSYAEMTAIEVTSGRRIGTAPSTAPSRNNAEGTTERQVVRVKARGASVVPGAIVCPDHNTVSLVFRLYVNYREDTLQDTLTHGQSRLIRGEPTPKPDFELYRCALLPPGTPMLLELGNVVPVVNTKLPDGTTIRGVTLGDMIAK